MKKLLNRNAWGVETWMHHDGETIAIEHKQDVAAILDLNKKLRNEFEGYRDSGDHHHHKIAHIPDVVIVKWRDELGIDVFDPNHADGVKRLLNSNEWAHLRTSEGWI